MYACNKLLYITWAYEVVTVTSLKLLSNRMLDFTCARDLVHESSCEPTYGLKVSFVYVYKTRLLLYKATTLHGVRKRFEFSLSFG